MSRIVSERVPALRSASERDEVPGAGLPPRPGEGVRDELQVKCAPAGPAPAKVEPGRPDRAGGDLRPLGLGAGGVRGRPAGGAVMADDLRGQAMAYAGRGWQVF